MKRALVALLFAAAASTAYAQTPAPKKPEPKVENVQLKTENKTLSDRVTYLTALVQALKGQRDDYLDNAALRTADFTAAQMRGAPPADCVISGGNNSGIVQNCSR